MKRKAGFTRIRPFILKNEIKNGIKSIISQLLLVYTQAVVSDLNEINRALREL